MIGEYRGRIKKMEIDLLWRGDTLIKQILITHFNRPNDLTDIKRVYFKNALKQPPRFVFKKDITGIVTGGIPKPFISWHFAKEYYGIS